MDISTNLDLISDRPVEARLALYAEVGFTHVSIPALMLVDLVSDEAHFMLRDAIGAAGLKVDWVHAPFRKLWTLYEASEERRMVSLAALRFLVRRTGDLGARALVLHIVRKAPHRKRVDEAKQQLVAALQQLVADGEDAGVKVAVENQNDRVRDPYVTHVLDAVPDLGLCFDAAHASNNRAMDLYLKRHADRIAALHLHDERGRSDQHILPGEGNVDWKQVIAGLRGYGGVWGVEAAREPDESGAEAAEAFVRDAYSRVLALASGHVPSGEGT